MNRYRGTGGIGPIRLGSAIIGATILLRADAAAPPVDNPQPHPAPRTARLKPAPLTLPVPVFGMKAPQAGPAKAHLLPPPGVLPLKPALLAAPSQDVIAMAITIVEDPIKAPQAEPLAPAALAPATFSSEPQNPIPHPETAAPVIQQPLIDAAPEPLVTPQAAPLLLAANDDQPPKPVAIELPAPAFGLLALDQAPESSATGPELSVQASPAMLPEPGTVASIERAEPAPLELVASGDAETEPPPVSDPSLPEAAQADDQIDQLASAVVMPASLPVAPEAGPVSPPATEDGSPALPVPQFGGEAVQLAGLTTDARAEPIGVQPAVLRILKPAAPTQPAEWMPMPEARPAATARPAAQPLPATDAMPARLAPGGARIGAGRSPEFTYDDELVLQIRTADGAQGDTLIAYGTRSGVYLPLGAMARFLDLAIAVSDDGHFASGWFLTEKRRLTLDLRQGELIVEGRSIPLAPDDAAAFEGELYLRAERFAELFPLEVKVNLRDQSVAIRTLEPFPFEERLARERDRSRLESRGASTAAAQKWPREDTPWKALSFPMADIELRAASDQSLGERLEGDLRLAGDVAFMTGQAFLSGSTSDGLVGARLSLGRQDPDARLLGPLKASEFQLGDVSSAAMPLGLRGTSGRGIYLANQPLEQASVFDRVDLRGSLPDGYEVELYRNNILIGSTRDAVNGQYEFLQVPVEFGLNVLRFVFYGPQGQRREEVRRISVGDGRLSPGQLVYNLGMVQKDMNLFDVRGPRFSPSQDFGAWRYSSQLSYGLTAGLTASLGAAWFQSDGNNHWQANAGLRTGIAGMAARIDVAMQDRGARAFGAGLGGKLFGMGFRATHLEYRGAFIDEVRVFSSDPLRRATELDLTASLAIGGEGGFSLPLSARFRRIERADGRKQTDAMLRGSARIGTLLVSNTIDYSATSAPGLKGTRQALGSFDLATLSGSRSQLRGSASYEIAPRPRLIAGGIEYDRQIDERTTVRVSVNQTFVTPETILGLSASRQLGKMTLAFNGTYGLQRRNHSFLLRLGFSFGRNPLTGGYFVAQPGLASSGALAMRAFRDSDGDGRYGQRDTPLEDITFVSGAQQVVTDREGQGLMGGLVGGTRASFQVDADSLPDISMVPVTRGKEIVPRPGRIHVSDFAIQEMSDLEGTALFAGSWQQRGVSGLSLILVDSEGNAVRKVRSEADGFFLFEQLKPGHYRLVLEPEQARRLGIFLVNPVEIDVGASYAVLRRDLIVGRKESQGRGN